MKRTTNTFSRRQFLGSATALLATGKLAGSLSAVAAEPAAAKIVVGAHPWVYASTLPPPRDITPLLPAIFADMEYAGMDGIELMPIALKPDDAVGRIGELAQKHHLAIIGASFEGKMFDRSKHSAILEEAELVITRLAKLGGRTLGTSVGQGPKHKTSEHLDAQAEVLRKIIALGQANGVVLNLHNHTYEIADDLYDLKGTLARIPDAKLGPDIGWLARGGVDPVTFIHQYGRQIVFCHFRDQTADNKWSEAMGEGAMDYPGIVKALREAGFHGDIVTELAFERDFKPTRPIRDSFKLSAQYVRKLLGQ
jgi:sugar phosphate isomerase/epimerase